MAFQAEVVAVIDRDATRRIQVAKLTNKYGDYCDVREWYSDGTLIDEGTARERPGFKAGTKGIAIPVGLLPDVIKALRKLQPKK